MRTQDKDVKGVGRVLRGQVSQTGGIVVGSGFVASNSTNLTTVTFLKPFVGVPIVVVTSVTSGRIATLNATPTASGFVVYGVLPSGTTAAAAFEFVAIQQDPA